MFPAKIDIWEKEQNRGSRSRLIYLYKIYFYKDVKVLCAERITFSNIHFRTYWAATCKHTELPLHCVPYTRTNFEGTTDKSQT